MKQKKLGKLLQDLQKEFNKFIRERDKNLPCISCGLKKELQAGHYFAVKGYSGLRFDEDNCHGECAGCNRYDESHLINYGINLKKKIGARRYNKLLEKACDYKKNGIKWDRSEIEEKIIYYKTINAKNRNHKRG